MNHAQREIVLNCTYLNFPVKFDAPKRSVALTVDGVSTREFEIELADGQPDFWAFIDMSEWIGKTVIVRVANMPDDSRGLDAIECSDKVKADKLYKEELRPLFHFTSKRGWLNDPNGLVYYAGEYHLFYQHNPYGVKWGNIHWGHAVSTDLFHWKELPEALYPRTMAKGYCFSGSAVVDEQNMAGFEAGNEKTLVALFTDTDRGEAVAYSNDRGRTWTYAPNNPVVEHDGRDPKVFWYAPGKHWVMALYDVQNGKQEGIAFYTSSDLKGWKKESWIEGYAECPDIYTLPLDGDPTKTEWVLSAANGEYQIGSFDGKTFTPKTQKIRYNYGNCYYAAQTFNNTPKSDNRRIQIAWGYNAVTPGMPFSQCMLIPVSLSLHSMKGEPRLYPYPVKEIESLRVNGRLFDNVQLGADHSKIVNVEAECLDVAMECSTGNAAWIVANARGVPIMYDVLKQVLYCQGCVGPLQPHDGKIHLRILVDRSTIEIFGNDGELYMPVSAIPDALNRSLAVSCDAMGKAVLDKLSVYELRSIWK